MGNGEIGHYGEVVLLHVVKGVKLELDYATTLQCSMTVIIAQLMVHLIKNSLLVTPAFAVS